MSYGKIVLAAIAVHTHHWTVVWCFIIDLAGLRLRTHYILIVLHLPITLHKKYKILFTFMLRIILLFLFISDLSGIGHSTILHNIQ